jgi:c-di-AMP phosphodiesterase-like protein
MGSFHKGYLVMITFVTFLAVIALQQNEKAFIEFYHLNRKNKEEKKKWLSVLDNLPFFIMIYNNKKDEVDYINDFCKQVFFPCSYD